MIIQRKMEQNLASYLEYKAKDTMWVFCFNLTFSWLYSKVILRKIIWSLNLDFLPLVSFRQCHPLATILNKEIF